MPKRDRNHELETESQRAFENAMPSSVVVRPISDDYGIDREVEVFIDGQTTGLTFKVQLKGTDKSGTSRRVKRSSIEYWNSLDVPVLLVSYEAPSRKLRGRWIHSIGFEGPDNGAQTLTIALDADLGLEDVTAESLAADLALIRSVKRGVMPVPTPIVLSVSPESGISKAQLTAAILVKSRRTPLPMKLAENRAGMSITIDRRRVQVALPLRIGSGSLSISNDVQDLGVLGLTELAFLLAGLSVSLVNPDHARQWLVAVDPRAEWWGAPGLAERIAPVLNHASVADHLMTVYTGLTITDNPATMLYSTPMLERQRDVNEAVFQTSSAALSNHLHGHSEEGRLAFNLANMHRIRKDFERSIELYTLARAKSAMYRNDPLTLRYLGSAQWEIEDYEASVASYKEALHLRFDSYELLPLLADSLLYAGRYREARTVLKDWRPLGVSADKAGALRIVILDYLLETVAVDEQDRVNFDHQAVRQKYDAAKAGEALDEELLLDLLRQGDALHPLPWIELIRLDPEQIRFEPSLVVAFVLSHDAKAWAIALASGLDAGISDDVLRALIDQARYLAHDSFYDEVMTMSNDFDAESGDYLRELISAAYSTEMDPLKNRQRFIRKRRGRAKWDILESHISTDLNAPW